MLAVAGLVVSVLAVVPPAPASAQPADVVGESSCQQVLSADNGWGMTRAELQAGSVTILGRTAPVAAATFSLRTAPFNDAARRLWWHSGYWLVPAFYPLVDPTDTAGVNLRSSLLSGLLRALDANPDPGAAGRTPAALAPSNATGWDEGTNMRREQVLNCLLWATGFDSRITRHLNAAVRANLDMNRYDGPPYRAVSNHATLANFTLIDTADLLGQPSWSDIATRRLYAEIDGVFSPAGFSLEQSTSYLDMNVSLWRRTLDMLEDRPHPIDLRPARATLAQAGLMEQYLTTPQGSMVRIGDGDPVRPWPVVPHRFLGVLDRAGGVAANRWSWTDPRTSFYAVRFGLSQRAHGHDDHGSLLYSTLGVPVLVHPGTFLYSTKQMWGCTGGTSLACYARGPLGANVAYPTKGGVLARLATSSLTSLTRAGAVDTIRLVDRQFTTPIARSVRVDDRQHTLAVTDTATVSLSQRFHLDPAWTYTGRTNRSVSFRDGERRLTVALATPGAVNVFRGSYRSLAGWYFPSYGVMATSYEVVTSGGRTMTAIITVR